MDPPSTPTCPTATSARSSPGSGPVARRNVEPYLDRYLEDAPRIARRGQAFAADVADAAPRVPMALPRFERFRDDLEAAAGHTDNTVLQRGWRDTVDDYDEALLVRRAG